jgi:flagellar biosynthesis/type III secretory pathway protein FliH
VILRNVVRAETRHRLNAVAECTAPQPAPAQLLPAEVHEWLKKQDAVERRAVAVMLAPELADLRSEAISEGYEHGHAEGMRDAEDKYIVMLGVLSEIAQGVRDANDRANSQLAEECAAIVGEAFAKLGAQALITPAALVGAVQACVKSMREASRYIVSVHPGDLDSIAERRVEIEAALDGISLEIVTDTSLSSGGCRVQSEFESLDGCFERQLTVLFAALADAHAGTRT